MSCSYALGAESHHRDRWCDTGNGLARLDTTETTSRSATSRLGRSSCQPRSRLNPNPTERAGALDHHHSQSAKLQSP